MILFPITATRKKSRLINELSEDERLFLNTRQLEGSKPPSDWSAFLSKMQQLDSIVEVCRKGWRNSALLSFALAIIFAIAGSETRILLIAGSLPAALVTIACLVCYLNARSKDIPNAFSDIAAPLATIIGEDVKDGAELHLKLSLSNAETKESLIHTEKLKPFPGKSVKRSVYLAPWFACQARLADGAQLSLTLTDTVRVDKIKKSNGRKTKFKTKRKIKRLVDVSIGWPKGLVELQESSQPKLKQSLKSDEKRDTLRIRKTFITTNDNYFESWTKTEEIYAVVFEAYQNANPRKAS